MLVLALLALPPAARATPPPVIVHPGSSGPWTILNRDAPTGAETSGPTPRGTRTGFADGPAATPAGLGSLQMIVGASDDSARIETGLLGGLQPADIGPLSYSTYVRQGRAGAAAAMQLLIDRNGDGRFRTAEDDVLTFEPVHQHGGAPGTPVPNQCGGVNGCVATGGWQAWDAAAGGWWSLRAGTYGPPLVTLAGYQALHPAARVAGDVAALRVIAGGGPSWEGFDGFVDAVRAGGGLYDFELMARVADCAAATDDIAAVQTAIDAAPPGFGVRLRGSCDFGPAAPQGGTAASIEAAAVVVGSASPARDLVIEPDGPPGSAAVTGTGVQAAFFVPPGARDVTIRGLRFTGFARPVVIVNAERITIGVAGSAVPSAGGNALTGGVSTGSAILAVADPGGPNGTLPVRYGVAGGRTASYPAAGARLAGLTVAGNRIAYDAAGVPDAVRPMIGIDVRAVGAGRIEDVRIDGNAVWFVTNEFRSFDMNGIRVQGSAGVPAESVAIAGNSIGRPEELGEPAPSTASGGRVGILVHRAAGVVVERNRVRATVSATPAADVPGGGIVVADTRDAAVRDNAVVVVAGEGTEPADLGAIGVVDDLDAAFGAAGGPPATTRVQVTGNRIGTPGQPGIGAHRGLVVAGASWVDASDNTVVFSQGPAIALGPEIRGPAGSLPRSVTASVLCGNDLHGSVDDPNRIEVSGATTNANFPGGSLVPTNGECAPAGIAIAETGGSTTVAEAGGTDVYTVALTLRPRTDVTVSIAGGANATAAPSVLTFTPVDWATPRTVTIEAVQDSVPEGTHLQAITHTVASADAAYAGIARTLLVFVLDDDPGSVQIAETGGSTEVAEGGATDTYTVVLGSRPGADVRVIATAGSQLVVSPATTVFTPADWSVPRTVTVSAADDTLREGPHLATIAHRAVSADPNFDGTPVGGIVVRIADNDAPPPPVVTSPAAGSRIRVSGVVIAGRGEPQATVTVREGGVPLGSGVVGAAGTWSIGPVVFTEGAHTVQATQTDPNGFASGPASHTFTVDLTPPQAPVIVSPAEGQVFLFAGIEIRGTAEPSAVVVVSEGAIARSTVSDATGAWKVVMVFAEGVRTVVATIYDGAGNAGPSSPPRTFTVNADGIPPDPPAVISPPQDGVVAERFTLTGTTEPLARVEVWEGSIPILGGSAGSDGFFAVELELESRTWLLRVRAIDRSFNVGAFAPVRRVHVDGVAPTVSVRKPVPLPVVPVPPDEEVTAFGAASDNYGVDRVEVTYTNLFGDAITRRATLCCEEDGVLRWSDRTPLARGRYLVTAYSYDIAGNRSRGSSIEILRL